MRWDLVTLGNMVSEIGEGTSVVALKMEALKPRFGVGGLGLVLCEAQSTHQLNSKSERYFLGRLLIVL